MKTLITERFKFLISWLKKEGHFRTNKELGMMCGVTNEATLSAAINGVRPNHAFVDRVCELDERVNKKWLYEEDVTNMLNDSLDAKNFANIGQSNITQDKLKYIDALESLLSYKDKEIAELTALVAELQSKIARLQRTTGETEA